MQLTRRNFAAQLAKSVLMFSVVALAVPLGGCSAITSLEQWIPVALTSVSAIVKLLGPLVPAPVAATIVLIQTGFSALLTAIQNFKAGSGVLADITNAISAVEASFANFFQTLSVPSTMLNLIEGLAGIILSTIAAFANQIQPTPTPSVMLGATIGGTKVTYTPKKRSIKQYKSDWNAMCLANNQPSARI